MQSIKSIGRLDRTYCGCHCFEQFLDLDQLRRRAGKKRRGHDERNLAHQGSQATPFLGRIRATSAGSCDAGASAKSRPSPYLTEVLCVYLLLQSE
jgi:hypothetical protein